MKKYLKLNLLILSLLAIFTVSCSESPSSANIDYADITFDIKYITIIDNGHSWNFDGKFYYTIEISNFDGEILQTIKTSANESVYKDDNEVISINRSVNISIPDDQTGGWIMKVYVYDNRDVPTVTAVNFATQDTYPFDDEFYYYTTNSTLPLNKTNEDYNMQLALQFHKN